MKAVPRLFTADLVQKPLQRTWSGAHLVILHLWSCICEDTLSSSSPNTLLSWLVHTGTCLHESDMNLIKTRHNYLHLCLFPGTILRIL